MKFGVEQGDIKIILQKREISFISTNSLYHLVVGIHSESKQPLPVIDVEKNICLRDKSLIEK